MFAARPRTKEKRGPGGNRHTTPRASLGPAVLHGPLGVTCLSAQRPTVKQPASPPVCQGSIAADRFLPFTPSCKRNPGHNTTNQRPTHHKPRNCCPGCAFSADQPGAANNSEHTSDASIITPCIAHIYIVQLSLRFGMVPTKEAFIHRRISVYCMPYTCQPPLKQSFVFNVT